MYTPKNLSFGFVILCHNNNVNLVKITAKSLFRHYPGIPFIIVTGKGMTKEETLQLKEIGKVVRGKSSYSSLFTAGLKYAPADWNFFVIAGSWVRHCLDCRFSHFLESEKEILFPISNNQWNFVDGTLNGLFIHKNAYKDIGPWPDESNLELCKLKWALTAMEAGYKFKAIANTKIC